MARISNAYIPSEEDPLVLIPDPEVVRRVEDAFDHLDQGHSSRRVASWLGEKTGKTISHQGITNIWKQHSGPDSDKLSKLLKERNSTKKSYSKGPSSSKDSSNETQTVRRQACPHNVLKETSQT